MAYQAQINRATPTAFLFLVDQSGSMNDKLGGLERTKAQFVADVLNKTLFNFVTRCTRADGVRDYFDVGVIGYGVQGATNALQGSLGAKLLNPISALESNPLRVESRKKKEDDGAGGLIERSINFPVWFEPAANGGTPMCEAMRKAGEELAAWCDAHPDSYPPTVLHITDGESTDGDPAPLADALQQFSTRDGNVVLMNLHVSAITGSAIPFPSSEQGLPDQYAKALFKMSSQLHPNLIKLAKDEGFNVSNEARGYVFNSEAAEIVAFFEIGTKAAQITELR